MLGNEDLIMMDYLKFENIQNPPAVKLEGQHENLNLRDVLLVMKLSHAFTKVVKAIFLPPWGIVNFAFPKHGGAQWKRKIVLYLTLSA